jgi:hypothetical protein
MSVYGGRPEVADRLPTGAFDPTRDIGDELTRITGTDAYAPPRVLLPLPFRELGECMRRREFIGLMGTAALSFARPGYAQTKTDMPVVGLLLLQKPDTTVAKDRITALRKGLQEAG